jgi:hypothetical protein
MNVAYGKRSHIDDFPSTITVGLFSRKHTTLLIPSLHEGENGAGVYPKKQRWHELQMIEQARTSQRRRHRHDLFVAWERMKTTGWRKEASETSITGPTFGPPTPSPISHAALAAASPQPTVGGGGVGGGGRQRGGEGV